MCWCVLEELGLEQVVAALGQAAEDYSIVDSIAEQTESYQACSREETWMAT